MTLPTIVPVEYSGTALDFLKVKVDRSGAARMAAGKVTVPSGTAFTTIVGLFPFNKGARFEVNSFNVHCGNFGAATTTIDLGIVYNDNTNNTNDVDAFAAASTAPQSGGFVTPTNVAGLQLVTTADGWVVATINTANADADGDITFSIPVAYDGLGQDNSNNQS